MKLNVKIKIMIILSILFLSASLIGCVRTYTGEIANNHTLTENVEYEKLESIDVDIKMGVGKLNVSGGTKDIFEGSFIYSIDSWKPIIDYNSTSKKGHLLIEQPSSTKNINIKKNQKYQWDISLTDELPMNLDVKLGVGSSILTFDTMNLQNLNIEMGVGETEIDLSGDWKEDVTVSIEGGIGSATISLPKDIGVIIEIEGGIGTINSDGLSQNGNIYTNDLYNNSNVNLIIDIEAGIGEITFN